MREDKLYHQIDLSYLKTEKQKTPSRKISENVFDNETLSSLQKLASKGYFNEVRGLISTGKEANVYRAKTAGGEVALKLYKVETSDFRHMSKYIRGDPRFSSWKNRRQLVYMWAQKEYKNLKRIHKKVNCPEPIAQYKNVLVMQFLGVDGIASPKLKDADVENPKKVYKTIMGYVKKMYGLRVVHADLSEYNVLIHEDKPYLIDLSAGVLLDHPSSHEFLKRDIGNIVNYFNKLGVSADQAKALKGVLGGN